MKLENSTRYFVKVEGKAWSGFKGELVLEFSSYPNLAMVKSEAGDFEHYRIVWAEKVTTVRTSEGITVPN